MSYEEILRKLTAPAREQIEVGATLQMLHNEETTAIVLAFGLLAILEEVKKLNDNLAELASCVSNYEGSAFIVDQR